MSTNRPQLAFVDHPFHKKTKSADFLRIILKRKYEIKNFWQGEYKMSELKKYDNIFFFQSFLNIKEIFALKNNKIVWAPMYDSMSNFDPNILKICSNFSNIKILSFSQKIQKLCKKFNLEHLYCKYYLRPKKLKPTLSKKIKIFFWYRGQIKINEWINLFKLSDIQCIYYYQLVDPFFKKDNISKKYQKKYKIKFLNGNFKMKDTLYMNKIIDSDVFISPRKKEGIGMSYLEALSLLKYIVAYDESTMNEYVNNAKIGFLFDQKTKTKVNINNVKKYLNFRYIHLKKEYQKWLLAEKRIENIFIGKNVKKEPILNFKFLVLYIQNMFFYFKIDTKKTIIKILNLNNK